MDYQLCMSECKNELSLPLIRRSDCINTLLVPDITYIQTVHVHHRELQSATAWSSYYFSAML